MDTRIEFNAHSNVVAIRGDIDVASAAQLRAAVAAAAAAHDGWVTLDLSHCTFMDSSGIHEMAEASAAGIRIELRNVGREVRSVLSITGVDRRVSSVPH
ncbi:MAG: STAS domain-containing protein [Microthrixaceae bacterium]